MNKHKENSQSNKINIMKDFKILSSGLEDCQILTIGITDTKISDHLLERNKRSETICAEIGVKESAEDERIPEPEIITSEQADESPKQDTIAKDEPADLPNFSNTPLQRYYQHILENIRR